MDFLKLFSYPFTWGLLLGFVFTGLAIWAHLKTKMEFRRYKKHLSDKLEIEAEQLQRMKKDKEKLGVENENLRLKVGNFKEVPARELERELEIFARAEKTMMLNAPGFAAAWETAKSAAKDEIVDEERGKSLPQRVFRKFFKTNALPEAAELVATGREILPAPAEVSDVAKEKTTAVG